MIKWCKLFLLVAALLVATAPKPVLAHGGVSVEDDKCIMAIGRYSAHFTGYQPAKRASQEFCEDIPEFAPAIIVLDYVDFALRDMALDFRVIRDVKEIGVTATYQDLGTEEEIEAATIFYKPAEVYKHGSFDVKIEFDKPGGYIGIVKAQAEGQAGPYISVFPFSVGITNYTKLIKWIIGAVLLGVAFIAIPRLARGSKA